MVDSVKLPIKVRKTIEKYSMLQKNDRIIVAVSGGCDSVALLRILYEFSSDWNLFLIVGHLNHGIRKESEVEEDFVRNLARSLELPYEVERVNVISYAKDHGLSVEMAGRELRYRFLLALASRYGASKIALGHNQNDHVETILLNLTRGSGIEGLRGIQPVRDGMIIRPLIFCTKMEIQRYLESLGISYMIDSSNRDMRYTRNRIRNVLIPVMKQNINPRIEEALYRLSRIAASQDDFIRSCSLEALEKVRVKTEESAIIISTEGLAKLHEAIQGGVIRLILENMSPGGKGIYWIHVNSVKKLALAEKCSGFLNMPHGITVEKRRGSLVFIPPGQEFKGECLPYEYSVDLPCEIFIPEANVKMSLRIFKGKVSAEEMKRDKRLAYMDLDSIDPPLKVRNRRPGDVFHPLGMEGRKKLKDFFIDEKIDKLQRNFIPLLTDMKGIVWVGGLRIDERVRIRDTTQNVLKAEII
ncbi:MAG: tRNA lysidine(34) synthetase TilS [Syntrophales bacterium]|nr:tRNA lysidine(34) synthetase TilS [Syntrophales bacterium]